MDASFIQHPSPTRTPQKRERDPAEENNNSGDAVKDPDYRGAAEERNQ